MPSPLSGLTPQAKIVVLTGAGISAESGVPTFRGKAGSGQNFKAEALATPEAFKKNPALVWEWYKHRREISQKANPNPAHYALVEMEKSFPHFTLITQNVDNLHQRAGSQKLLELHGNIFRARCPKEGKILPLTQIKALPPLCACGAVLRPDVVWFGESLAKEVLDRAMAASAKAEYFFLIGTSALVYPAAALPLLCRQKGEGGSLIEINPEETPLSRLAVTYRQAAAVCLPEIWQAIKSSV